MNYIERKNHFINKLEFLLKWRNRMIITIIVLGFLIILATVLCYILWNNLFILLNIFILTLFILPLTQNLLRLKQLSKDLPNVLKGLYIDLVWELKRKPFYSKTKKKNFIKALWDYDLSQEEVKEPFSLL